MVAWAINESYLDAVAECVAPFVAGKGLPFSRRGIGSIKGYPRMHNKMLSGPDHRYEPKPRPGMCGVVCARVCVCVCVCVCQGGGHLGGMFAWLLRRTSKVIWWGVGEESIPPRLQ